MADQSFIFGATLAVVLILASTLAAEGVRLQVHYDAGTKQQVLAAAAQKGYQPVKDHGPRFEVLVFESGKPTAAQDLASIANVTGVAESVKVTVMKSDSAGRPDQDVDGTAGPTPAKSVPKRRSRSLLQQASPATCPASPNTPDDKPPSSSQEIKPYGISMVQADHPAVQAAARSAADNVLFCVISDGVAATHPDLAGNNLRGNGTCYNETVLVTSEGDIVSAVQVCTRWDDPQTSLLGTHVVGTIAALQNGQGVVGTSSTKSNVYMINGFGSRDFLYDDEILDGVGDCISELERLQKSNPATKMVVNINGAGERYAANPNPNGTAYNRPANQLTTHYTGVFAYFEKPFNKMYKRGDVLFIAPSGFDGTSALYSPAGLQTFISVAAVDWKSRPAQFSSFNNDVELAAPGVNVMSTVSLQAIVGKPSREPILPRAVSVSTTPALAGVDFTKPPPETGAYIGQSLSAEVVDCGLGINGTDTCNAKGKICLMRRGDVHACQKMQFCQRAGGIGAILYNRADRPCEVWRAPDCLNLKNDTKYGQLTNDLPAVGLAFHQGDAIRKLLAANTTVSAALSWPDAGESAKLVTEPYASFDFNGAPAFVSGVAGIVWGANPGCSNEEIRKALQMSALDMGLKGRDDRYGYGIVQAKAALDYLAANPCKGRVG